MIDPYKITDFNRSQMDLEEFWIFCICVAGKEATRVAKVVDGFIQSMRMNDVLPPFTPLERVSHYQRTGELMGRLRAARIGQYGRISRALQETVDKRIDLRNDPLEVFEGIYGVGGKTSRFFLLHSRPNQNIAVLDTHILKFLREKGYNAPKSTPPKKLYRELELAFLKEASASGKPLHEFDLELWTKYKDKTV